MQIEIVTSTGRLAEIADEWDAFSSAFDMLLLQHDWSMCAAKAFTDREALRVIIQRSDQGEIQAIAPLVLTRTAAARHLRSLGHQIREPTPFLAKRDVHLDALFRAIRGRGSLVLERLSIESPAISWCDRNVLYARESSISTSPYVLLPQSVADFESSMSSGRRSDLRRYVRRAEKFGKIRTEVVCPTPDDLNDHLTELFRVEASGWKGRNGTAVTSNAEMQRFYTLFADVCARNGTLRLFFFWIGEEIAAVRMAVVFANSLWDLKIGFDEKWKDCSPGIILTHETLKWACLAGLATHEFLGYSEPWEQIWTDKVRTYVRRRFYPRSVHGLVTLTQDSVGHMLPKLTAVRAKLLYTKQASV